MKVHFATAKPLGDVIAQFFCGARSHVGANEVRKEFRKKLIIDQPPFVFEEVADVGVERAPRLFE